MVQEFFVDFGAPTHLVQTRSRWRGRFNGVFLPRRAAISREGLFLDESGMCEGAVSRFSSAVVHRTMWIHHSV